MQPTHATSDMPWAESRIGAQRLEGAYAWQRFLRAHVRIALGSDFPVESPDPRLGLYAAVTRQDLTGFPPGGWMASQRLTPAEALRGFTSDAAWAGFMEREVGRLEPGMHRRFRRPRRRPADGDAFDAAPIEVLSTWVDGARVY